ncbi:MAG: response regulator transcription factor [Candidatus Omnitrophica bacterium]|nr:response regulator transcription factor [Candidatus Omnitrophota bacterium]
MDNNKKVMIIDDDKEFLDEITETLKLSGYEPIPLSESHKAVKEILKIKPDVVLLDLKMDVVSGFKIANELDKMPDKAKVPIIAITGVFTEKEHRLLMKTCGIAECLTKPFNPLDVIAAIERIYPNE